MLASEYYILNDAELTDADKVLKMQELFGDLVIQLLALRNTITKSNTKLDTYMDANGNNANEHYAKTMMFYGRKFCADDLLKGVTNAATNDKYKYKLIEDPDHPELYTAEQYMWDIQYGIDKLLWMFYSGFKSKTGTGNRAKYFHITWNTALGDGANIFREDAAPEQTTCEQWHAPGSNVYMPTIKSFTNTLPGYGNTATDKGTNTYLVKSGYVIRGWVLDQGATYDASHRVDDARYWVVNDDGLTYKMQKTQTKSGSGYITTEAKIPDVRLFEFDDDHPAYLNTNKTDVINRTYLPGGSSTLYKLPYTVADNSTGGLNYRQEIVFKLAISKLSYNVEFYVYHVKGDNPTTPRLLSDITLRNVRLGDTVTLPAVPPIVMDDAWEIDYANPAGTWTTIITGSSPSTTDMDPDPAAAAAGIHVPERELLANSQQVIGEQMTASIHRLYLKVKPKGS